MLKNDIRYVIKRVVVAILIAMIIFFLKSNNVLALSWDLEQKDEFFIFDTAKPNDWTSTRTGNAYTFQGSTFDHNYTNTNGYNFMVIPLIYTITFSDSGSTSGTNYSEYGLTDVVLRVVLVSDGNWSTCELQNNFAVCPILKDLTYSAIRFYYVAPGSVDSYTVRLRINNAVSLQNFSTPEAITQIAQATQEAVNDQKDNSDMQVSDINVNQMENITGLLPAGPLDSLLALPLNLINILVAGTSGTCTPFTFTFVFNQEMSLPCFDTFWNQVPSSLLLFLSDLPAVYIFIQWAKSIYKRVERAVSFESSVDDEWGGV